MHIKVGASRALHCIAVEAKTECFQKKLQQTPGRLAFVF